MSVNTSRTELSDHATNDVDNSLKRNVPLSSEKLIRPFGGGGLGARRQATANKPTLASQYAEESTDRKSVSLPELFSSCASKSSPVERGEEKSVNRHPPLPGKSSTQRSKMTFEPGGRHLRNSRLIKQYSTADNEATVSPAESFPPITKPPTPDRTLARQSSGSKLSLSSSRSASRNADSPANSVTRTPKARPSSDNGPRPQERPLPGRAAKLLEANKSASADDATDVVHRGGDDDVSVDPETIDKCRKWVDSLPPKFSGLPIILPLSETDES